MSILSKIRKAKQLERKGKYLDAIEEFNEILNSYPKNLEAKKGVLRINDALRTTLNGETRCTSGKLLSQKERDKLWGLYTSSRFEELLAYIETYLEYNEAEYELYFLAGSSCRHLKKFKKAMDYMKRALAFEPENYGANLEVAKLFANAEMHELADKTFDHCKCLAPQEPDSFLYHGKLKEELGELLEAKNLYHSARDLAPQRNDLLSSLGEIYFKLADYEIAHDYFNQAIQKSDKSRGVLRALLHSNRLNTAGELDHQDDLLESQSVTETLISENPEDLDLIGIAQFNLAISYLRHGKYQDGWRHWFHRFRSSSFPSPERKFLRKRARDLNELNGKTVLLWREQGIGDELLMFGLLNEISAVTNANFIVECDERLVTLARRSFPACKFRKESHDPKTLMCEVEDFDLHLPLGDMPILLNISNEFSEKSSPWLIPDCQLADEYNKTKSLSNIRIGFSWGSSLRTIRRDLQYLSLEFFEKLILEHDHEWVCLDHTINNEILETLCPTARDRIIIPDFDLKNDFERLSCMMESCDIIICPATAMRAHAGALGVKSASFYRNGRAYCDLGADLDENNQYKPPLIPNCTTLHLPFSLTENEVCEKLENFFGEQITKTIEDNMDVYLQTYTVKSNLNDFLR